MLYSGLLPAGVRSLYGIKREQQYREIYEKYRVIEKDGRDLKPL